MYDRTTQLKKLLHATDSEISDRETIISMLERAISGMIKNSAHWTYDINRHIALIHALAIEIAQ